MSTCEMETMPLFTEQMIHHNWPYWALFCCHCWCQHQHLYACSATQTINLVLVCSWWFVYWFICLIFFKVFLKALPRHRVGTSRQEGEGYGLFYIIICVKHIVGLSHSLSMD